MKRESLVERFRAHIAERRLFPDPGLALVAVSGGPDSVALLDLLHGVAPDLGLSLAVVHVDHGIDDRSADVAELVLGLAVRYGLRGHLSVHALGPGTSETTARDVRYEALRGWQAWLGARYLVTAHHADDQIETVLFRLLRGSGMAGLSGITERGADGLVRPLLPFGRDELRGWLASRDTPLPSHEDPANVDQRHDRSWIRVEALPFLRRRFGEMVDRNLGDLGRHARADRDAWSAALRAFPGLGLAVEDGAVQVDRSPLREYDSTLAGALLRAAAREVGCVIGTRRSTRLLDFARQGSSGKRLDLGHHWVAEIAFERLRIFRIEDGAAVEPGRVAVWGEAAEGRVQWGRWTIEWKREAAGRAERVAHTTWVTEGAGVVRALRRGDRVHPLRGRGRRPLRRLLMEGRVPRSLRTAVPIVARDDRILWIPGICRADTDMPVSGETALRLDAYAAGD